MIPECTRSGRDISGRGTDRFRIATGR